MDIEKSFRHSKSVTDNQKRLIAEAEDMFVPLAHHMIVLPDSREKSICLTKLQEAKFGQSSALLKIAAEKIVESTVGSARR